MDLKILGLNDYEAKCYETVVKLGRATAAIIAKESGVPYGRIYDVLSALEKRGFAKVIPGITKLYVPGDPQTLINSLKEKKEALEKVEKEVQELKNIYELKEVEPVIVAQGKANFYKIAKEREKSREFVYSIKYTSEPRPEWLRSTRERVQKKMDEKSLVKYDQETKENVHKFLKITPNIRKIKNEGVAIGIDENSIMIGLIKSNTTLLIRDKPFIKLMKDLFLAKFKEAEKINV